MKPLRRFGAAWRRWRSDPARLMRRWWPTLETDSSRAGEPTQPWATVARRLVARGAVAHAGLRALANGQVDLALEIARRALAAGRCAATLRAACRIAFDAAALDEAAGWAAELRAMGPDAGDHSLLSDIAERVSVLERLQRQRGTAVAEPIERRVACFLAYSLPYTSNGYATRSHGLLSALAARGWDVKPFTRPGYPADSDRAFLDRELAAEDVVGVLRYGRLQQSSRRRLGDMPYLAAAADEIRSLLRQQRPQLVHAASNYMTALPACLAAQESAIPFVYEVRGFWDVTRASSDPGFANSAECRHLRLFERELLRRADALITLTLPMKEELVRRGAKSESIFIAPNGVDATALVPCERDDALARSIGLPEGVPVIGYAGSFVDYEGLDDLVSAFALLRSAGTDCHLLLVGDGLMQPALVRQIADRSLQAHVTLTGRVPHAEVGRYCALMDVCPFPRKPWPVCDLVSPLKPFEAMAFGKAILVSGVAAMADAIDEGINGRIFAKGDVADLARCLGHMLNEQEATLALGESARQWVQLWRTWARSAAEVERAYAFALGMHYPIDDNPRFSPVTVS